MGTGSDSIMMKHEKLEKLFQKHGYTDLNGLIQRKSSFLNGCA